MASKVWYGPIEIELKIDGKGNLPSQLILGGEFFTQVDRQRQLLDPSTRK